MFIVVECPECGRPYKISQKLAGRKAKCRACGSSFTVEAEKKGFDPENLGTNELLASGEMEAPSSEELNNQEESPSQVVQSPIRPGDQSLFYRAKARWFASFGVTATSADANIASMLAAVGGALFSFFGTVFVGLVINSLSNKNFDSLVPRDFQPLFAAFLCLMVGIILLWMTRDGQVFDGRTGEEKVRRGIAWVSPRRMWVLWFMLVLIIAGMINTKAAEWVIAGLILIGSALVLVGGLGSWLYCFTEGFLSGLAYPFVPFYAQFCWITRWHSLRRHLLSLFNGTTLLFCAVFLIAYALPPDSLSELGVLRWRRADHGPKQVITRDIDTTAAKFIPPVAQTAAPEEAAPPPPPPAPEPLPVAPVVEAPKPKPFVPNSPFVTSITPEPIDSLLKPLFSNMGGRSFAVTSATATGEESLQLRSVGQDGAGQMIRLPKDNESPRTIYGLRFMLTPDGQNLVFVARWPKLTLQIMPIEAGKPPRQVDLGKETGQPMLLGFADKDRLVVLWQRSPWQIDTVNIQNGLRTRPVTVQSFDLVPSQIGFGPDGRTIGLVVSAAGKTELQVYDMMEQRLLRRLPLSDLAENGQIGRIAGVAFAPDKTKTLVLMENGANALLAIWEIGDKPTRRHALPAVVPTSWEKNMPALHFVANNDTCLVFGSILVELDGGRVMGLLNIPGVCWQRAVDAGSFQMIANDQTNQRHLLNVSLDQAAINAAWQQANPKKILRPLNPAPRKPATTTSPTTTAPVGMVPTGAKP